MFDIVLAQSESARCCKENCLSCKIKAAADNIAVYNISSECRMLRGKLILLSSVAAIVAFAAYFY